MKPLQLNDELSIEWTAASQPLEPVVAVAAGDALGALTRRLLSLSDADLDKYTGVACEGCMLVAGSPLPWVEGIKYLGRHADAPNLLLPTNLQCSVPLELLDRAVRALGEKPPVAVLPQINAVVSFSSALNICRDILQQYREAI